MIFTDRTITVRKGESRIDEPIVVYRGDYELEVRFTILNSRFKFMSGTNMIESEKASYGQLAILTPYGGNIFSDFVRCNDGSVTFVLTAEMLNQIEEVGLYSFQIRLMDYNKESRVSIPPIEFGIEVREPIASEDHDNSVNNAIVGYSIAKVVDPKEENVGDTFDGSGNYNKTKWETGDRISEGKLNKIEDAIDKINQNEASNKQSLNKQIMSNYSVLMSEIETEKLRIDSLARIENGETEGNTELLDIRIGENAHEYTLAGDHVRAISSGEALLNDSISVDHIDFISPVGNLFNGKYIMGDLSGYSTTDCIFENDNDTGRCAIIRVKPSTTYVITKGDSSKFRIAANDVYPRPKMKLKRYIKDGGMESSNSEIYDGETYKTFTFTTDVDEYYVIVYVSNISEEPEMQILEGDKEEPFSDYELFAKVPIKFDNISKGKNLFDGSYLNGTLKGDENEVAIFTENPGKVAIINVKPNTPYTISKTPSNRFRIGLLKVGEPIIGCKTYLIKGGSNDNNLETSIVTRENDRYLFIYVANGEGVNPPEFMQVEEGAVKTSWETYGYKFTPQAKGYYDSETVITNESSSTPEYYGAIGDANYIDTDGNVWRDSLFTIPATDDTEALKKLFTNKYVEFPHGKKYLITDTLNVSSNLVRMVNGNGSKLVTKGDIIAINFEGTLSGTANPIQSGDKVFNEHGAIIHGLHITSTNNEGTAIRVSKNFGGIIDKCDFSYLKIGCIIEEMNRNLIISNSHIYAMQQYGIYFTNTCDIHQINIIGNHISYCRKNIFLDDPKAYNMQITGCDIETSTYPSIVEHDIHVYIENGCLQDLEIVGNTIEDHKKTDTLIKFESLKQYGIVACAVSGNNLGNSKKHDISIKGVRGLAITGNSFIAGGGESLKIEGTSRNIVFTGNIVGSDGGLLYCDNTDANIKNLTVSDNIVEGKKNMIYVNAGILEGVNINGNTLSLNGVTNIDSSKAMVDISSKEINLTKIDNNLIYGSNELSTAIKIDSTSVRKTNCKDNISDNFNTDSDIYNINSQITTGNNI